MIQTLSFVNKDASNHCHTLFLFYVVYTYATVDYPFIIGNQIFTIWSSVYAQV